MVALVSAEDSTASLSHALLLYSDGRYGSAENVRFVSRHKVTHSPGSAPVIEAGEQLDADSLAGVLKQVAKGAGISQLQWCEENMIAAGSGIRCWWTPARSQWMHFSVGSFQRSAPAVQPAQLWISRLNDIYVFALQDNVRPTATTQVFQSPHLNVYSDGKLCKGSMPLKLNASTEEIESVFYGSVFTHANPSERKLTSFKGGNLALWKSLMDAPDRPFPKQCLIKTESTVSQILDSLESDE